VRHQANHLLRTVQTATLRTPPPRRFTAARPQYHGAHVGHIGYAPSKEWPAGE
jgi:hypothetical protein